MLKKAGFLMLLMTFNMLYNQEIILEKYPYGQEFYAGGNRGLIMEMIEITRSKKLFPCENKHEKYVMPILINSNGSINYVKEDDTLKISQNRCAYDFGRKIFPNMKRWMPAKSNDQYVGAIINVLVDPFFLLNSKDDPSKNIYTQPRFKKGMYKFSNEVRKIFESSIKENEDKLSSIVFFVNETGKTVDFSVEGNYSEYEKKNFIKELSKINIQIEPGTFNSIPIKTKMRLPLRQEFSLELEKDKAENEFKRMDSKFR